MKAGCLHTGSKDRNYCLSVEIKWTIITYLTLQEEEDSGLNEVGIGALSASPLGGTFLLWFPLAEQSLRILIISCISHKANPTSNCISEKQQGAHKIKTLRLG